MHARLHVWFARGLFLVSGWCGVTPASAALAPYFENFDALASGNTPVPNFIESNTAAYTIVSTAPANNAYQAVISSSSGAVNASSAIHITNLGAPQPFTLSTTFRIADLVTSTGSTLNLGFGVLGSDPNFSSGTQYRILFTAFSPTAIEHGTINIQKSGTTFSNQVRGPQIPVDLTSTYTLTLEGRYVGSSLSLTATATRSAGGTTTTTVTDSSPLTGQYFGYRTAVNAGAGGPVTQTIRYDNLSIVPEPGVSLLFAFAGGACLGFRRIRRG